MAFDLKKDSTNVPAAAAPQAKPLAMSRPQSSEGLGFDGISLIVAAIALLGAIGGALYAMKAMFVF